VLDRRLNGGIAENSVDAPAAERVEMTGGERIRCSGRTRIGRRRDWPGETDTRCVVTSKAISACHAEYQSAAVSKTLRFITGAILINPGAFGECEIGVTGRIA
jgi:hypothetical protein